MSKFPFQVSEPHKMTILEQVLCVVWMAENYTLEHLRACQAANGKQLQEINERNSTERVRKNLLAMQENVAATVAYQTLGEDSIWMSFIFDPNTFTSDGENF